MIKNLDILISGSSIFGLSACRKARYSIYSRIRFFLSIINIKVVLQERLGLADLIKAQVICICKLREIVIVSKNKALEFAAFSVVMSDICINKLMKIVMINNDKPLVFAAFSLVVSSL